MLAMDSHMAGPMCVKLSGVVGGAGGVTSAKKKSNFQIEIFFACCLTLYDLCTHDNSLSFEDCRLATHLPN